MYFSLGSSPTTIDLQFLYLFNIFIIAFPYILKPFDLFNLPTKEIIFFFLGKVFKGSILGYITSHLGLFFLSKPSKNFSFTQLLTKISLAQRSSKTFLSSIVVDPPNVRGLL